MKIFKNAVQSLTAIISTSYLILKKGVYLINANIFFIGLSFFLSVTIFSCTKENTFPHNTSLMIVQGTSDYISSENIFLDNNRISNQPLNYGTYTNYLRSSAGSHIIQQEIHAPGSLTYVGLASDTVLLNAANNYSLFLWPTTLPPINSYPGTKVSDQIGFTLLTDSLSQPAAGQSKIRFVDVSLGSGSVDLVMDGNILVSDKYTGGYSSFISVNPTTASNFEVRKTGSSVVLSTLKNINIKSGGIYTIWLYGPASDSQSSSLNLGIITNRQY